MKSHRAIAQEHLGRFHAAETDKTIRPILPVIFRKHYIAGDRTIGSKGFWEVTAFFPTLNGSTGDPYSMVCFAHAGQHGNASPLFMNDGKKCKSEEYSELLAELRSIYEDDEEFPVKLKVYAKQQQWMIEARRLHALAQRLNTSTHEI